MARLEPTLLAVVTDLERALRELGVPFGFVGALVPELLLAVDWISDDALQLSVL